MADRESTFANAEIIKLIQEKFVAVAADDWYQRRRDDEVGRFFVSVANQGPRKGEGGGTRQGIYCFTAGGKLLAYRNHRDTSVMLGEFRKASERFEKLPAAERAPGAVKVPDLADEKLDRRYTRKLPEGGSVLRVMTRVLERDADGKYTTCSAETGQSQRGLLTSQDHLWLTSDEGHAITSTRAKVGESFEVPASIRRRIARFHLIDNTRGEPPMWEDEHIRKNVMKLTVVESRPGRLKLRLEGEVLLSTAADPAKADRGYDAALLGYIDVDRANPAATRIDIVALGDHWGEGTYTRGARPGRTPLGIAFQLADGRQAADQVPPQAARHWDEYMAGAK